MGVQVFSAAEVDAMCARIGFTRADLHTRLRAIGPAALPAKQRSAWSPDSPVNQFCYRLVEAIHRSGRTPAGFVPMRKKDSAGSHYFFLNPATREIIDPTADQFSKPGQPRGGYDYEGARRASFLPQVSRGAQAIADSFGWGPLSTRPVGDV